MAWNKTNQILETKIIWVHVGNIFRINKTSGILNKNKLEMKRDEKNMSVIK